MLRNRKGKSEILNILNLWNENNIMLEREENNTK